MCGIRLAYCYISRSARLGIHNYTLEAFLKAMEGEWYGSLVQTSCREPDASPDRKVVDLSTIAGISVSGKGVLNIPAKREGSEDSVNRNEPSHLLRRSTILRFALATAPSDLVQ